MQLGRGESVQHLSGLPVALTKKMAHEFRATPAGFTVEQAIRRAQALGYGATAERAEVLAWSSLYRSFENEAFRADVIQFIAHVPEALTLDVVEPVLEFVFEAQRQDTAFRIWGRTWPALARLSAEWHRDMARKREAEDYKEWDKVMLTDFTLAKDLATFKIVQLTNSIALYDEGYEMAHCVAEYVYDCMEGRTAIFSLRKFTRGTEGFETLATLEVCPETMAVVQAKARYNDCICGEAEEVVTLWAKQENLVLDYDEYHGPPVAEQPPVRMNIFDAPAQRAAYSNTEDSGINWGVIIFALIKIMILAAKCSRMD